MDKVLEKQSKNKTTGKSVNKKSKKPSKPDTSKKLSSAAPENVTGTPVDEHEKILQAIISLGGSKKDLELLKDLSDPSDDEALEIKEGETEPLNKEDLQQFMDSIDIFTYRPKYEDIEEKKPVRLVEADPVESEEEEKPKKKKTKNKFKDKVQDSEISSTTSPEKTKPSTSQIKTEVETDDVKTEASEDSSVQDLAFLLKYMKVGYKHHNQVLVKEGKWLEQMGVKAPVHTGKPHPKIQDIVEFAKMILDDDTIVANSKKTASEKSDLEWQKKVVSSGTLSDRTAALTSLVQTDPIHNIHYLDNMVNMINKKDRRESMACIDQVKDLFTSLLPQRRRLRTFAQMPFEKLADSTDGSRIARDRTLALWYFESELKRIYATFVDLLIGATFDNLATHKTKALKVALELLCSKPEMEEKLLSAITNKLGDPDRKIASTASHLLCSLVKKHPNMKSVVCGEVEKILYRANISKKAQYYAICYLNQTILGKNDEQLADKLLNIYFSFFNVAIKSSEVDSKLMSALLVGVYRAIPFTKNRRTEQLESQINTLYKIVHVVQFTISLQALMLLYQISLNGENVSDRYYTALYSKMLDSELRTTSKQSTFLNLLFKSMKADPIQRRSKAFVKRLLQICGLHSPPFICSALIVISELKKHRPTILSLRSQAALVDDGDDDVERFVDIDDSDSAVSDNDDTDKKSSETSKADPQLKRNTNDYDGLKRNPISSNAGKCIETELVILSKHYHPSVSLFAKTILQGKPIEYSGQPFLDFGLQKFLDRFVFRNPKKISKTAAKKTSKLFSKPTVKPNSKNAVVGSVNSEEFYNLQSNQVPEDQRFFHSYFHTLSEALGKDGTKRRNVEEADDQEIADDDFDKYLWKYERQLYGENRADLGSDFAGNFKKRKGGDDSESDGNETDSDLEDFEDLRPEDFGLNLDELPEPDMTGVKRGRQSRKKAEASESEDDASDEEDDDDEGEGDVILDGAVSDDDSAASGDSGSEDLTLDLDGEGESGESDLSEGEIDEENIAFSDEDEFGDVDFADKQKLKKADKPSQKLKLTKIRPDSSDNLFSAADEFADLMEEEFKDKVDTITSKAVINKTNSSARQLAWEDKQEKWLEGGKRSRATGGKKGKSGQFKSSKSKPKNTKRRK